jgi:hypothetical protein
MRNEANHALKPTALSPLRVAEPRLSLAVMFLKEGHEYTYY